MIIVHRVHLVLAWVLLVVVFTAGATLWRWTSLVSDHERHAEVAHRIISQRADQHDAHMTGLSALAQATDPAPQEALRLVASTIRQFYPRVAAIDLIEIAADDTPAVMTTRPELTAPIANIIREVARRGSTKPVLAMVPGIPGHYLVIKRVPNSPAARYGLSLEIDVQALSDVDVGGTRAIAIQMAMPDGAEFQHRTGPLAVTGRWLSQAVMTFKRQLGSASQPLVLNVQSGVPLMAVVPWVLSAIFAVLTGLALIFTQRYRAARVSEHVATAKAAFRAQEVRLAHASRINAMGELALGIAHELTQPIAAVLSQSQAGLRIAGTDQPDQVAITKVLEANVRHAKRAGDILGKLRDWVSIRTACLESVAINRIISEVAELTRSDLQARNVSVALSLAKTSPMAIADRVELEQIVYNLLSNAADACERDDGNPAVVQVRTFGTRSGTGFEIHDDGPGIPADAQQKIFDPFFTSKPNGMGLGLTLCQRLVDRLGGQLTVANHVDGGAVFTVTLPAMARSDAVQNEAAE